MPARWNVFLIRLPFRVSRPHCSHIADSSVWRYSLQIPVRCVIFPLPFNNRIRCVTCYCFPSSDKSVIVPDSRRHCGAEGLGRIACQENTVSQRNMSHASDFRDKLTVL